MILDPETKYKVVIWSYNKAGQSSTVEQVITTPVGMLYNYLNMSSMTFQMSGECDSVSFIFLQHYSIARNLKFT